MPTLWLRIAAIAIAATALLVGFRAYNEHLRDQGREEVTEQWRQADAKAKAAADSETEARRASQMEIQRETQKLIDHAVDSSHRLAVGDQRLQHAAESAARACQPASDSAPGGDGEAIAGPGLVLADLFGRARKAASDLAPALDQARARGLSCERKYDALTAAGRQP
jgi:hypothetical protein